MLIIGLFCSAALPALAIPVEPFPLFPRYKIDTSKTDIYSGSSSYTYDINVPGGTDDLAPSISLTYNSGAVRDVNQRVGIGWQMSHDYVERDVNYTPTSTGDDKFKLHFQGAIYDLVKLPK